MRNISMISDSVCSLVAEYFAACAAVTYWSAPNHYDEKAIHSWKKRVRSIKKQIAKVGK